MTTISDPSAMTPDDPRWLSWFMQQRRFDRLSRKAQTGASLITDFASGVYEMGYPGQRRGNYELSDLITFSRASGGGRFNSSGVYEWVGNNVPRFDHDPVTLQPLGLLIEEQRTNLLLQSAAFSTSPWGIARARLSVDPTPPSLGGTAFVLKDDSSNNAHFIHQSVSFVSGTTYTLSLTAKRSGRNVRLNFQSAAFGALIGCSFDLAIGNAISTSPGVTPSVKYFGNGWYRCSITATATATAVATAELRLADDTGVTVYQGDGVSGAYLWGSQLEAGSSPSSDILTTTAQVTRAADSAAVNTLSPWYNASAGTWKVRAAGIVGQPLLTAGTAIITADSASTKDYSLSYSVSQSASSVVIGKGLIAGITYYPRSGA